MNREFSIAIVGAGMTGLALAALLANGRHKDALHIEVIDAGERPRFDASADIALRVSAIANGSADLLASVGAWDDIAATRVSAFDAMRVWDEHDGPDSVAALRFEAAEFAVAQLGFICENLLIQDALLDVLEATDVALRFNTRIDAMPKADLVVGADGARSRVRELAGIEAHSWPYEQVAVVTHLEPQYSHDRTAWQRFLSGGPLGMLPLADGRISVVWSTTPGDARDAMQASDAALGELLTRASDGVLGSLTVAGPKGAFDLCARHAEHYVMRGLALIGDAAHAIHPLAGQGANLGLRDAAELASVIDAALDAGLHIADRPVLRRYERARKGENQAMLHFMTGLNRLFTTDSVLVGKIRSAGMRLFNRSGPIRERAVRVALGVK